MTASRMRTMPAGPVLACVLAIAVVLMSGCIALGYRLAQDQAGDEAFASNAEAGNSLDFKRPEGIVVVDRIGDLSARLTRLEIEAAELARRLGASPPRAAVVPATTNQAADYRSQGGPFLPIGGAAPMAEAAAQGAAGDYGAGLLQLETQCDQLEASLDRVDGVLADRELMTMAYPNRIPVQGRMPKISSGFGIRRDPFTGRLAHHMGLDIPAAYGTPILASGGGRVISAGYRGPYGKAIVIDHGHGLQTVYGHCSKLYVRAGELVMPRQKIAAVGSTGRSTGPHLHFEVIRNGTRVEPGQVLASVLARNPD
jgi:murein DD-endopeptidase MepM/ murein hydrolase activator NlpD